MQCSYTRREEIDNLWLIWPKYVDIYSSFCERQYRASVTATIFVAFCYL
jgi:hypothetical protein